MNNKRKMEYVFENTDKKRDVLTTIIVFIIETGVTIWLVSPLVKLVVGIGKELIRGNETLSMEMVFVWILTFIARLLVYRVAVSVTYELEFYKKGSKYLRKIILVSIVDWRIRRGHKEVENIRGVGLRDRIWLRDYKFKVEEELESNIRLRVEENGKEMSKRDIGTAEGVLKEARDHIENINNKVRDTRLNKHIENKDVLVEFYKGLIEEPERITESSKYLHKLLPKLNGLVTSYVEVENMVVLREDGEEMLEESRHLIKKVYSRIEEEYKYFVEKDVRLLEDKVNKVINEGRR